MAAVSNYFTTKYELAHGISNAGIGVGSTAFPLLFDFLIEKYGWRGAALITGAICFQICWCGALILPIKVSCDEEMTQLVAHNETTHHMTICKRIMNPVVKFIKGQIQFIFNYPLLVVLELACMFYFIAYLNYQYFLPKVMTDLSYASTEAAFILTIAGVASTLGRVAYWTIQTVTGMSSVFTLLISLILVVLPMVFFPLLGTYHSIMVASVIYGLGSGSTTSLTIVTAKELVYSQPHHVTAIGWLYLSEGCGQLLGSTVGGKVYRVRFVKYTASA